VTRRDSSRLDVQGYVDMLRSKLLARFRERVGGGQTVLETGLPPSALLEFNLPARAGFLLSLVDGKTSVEELLSLSGLDPFDTLRMLAHLLDEGILRVPA